MDGLFSSVNQSGHNVTDLYEVYRLKQMDSLRVHKYVGFVLGTIIILSNFPVVVSSGLILRKGQKPRSTYMLLGNVSLADTIVGASLICGVLIENVKSPSSLCIVEIGMMVCPAMVSILSVGLIAVDRYIYILHGLYYKRWFSTTRVRIGIVLIWMIVSILSVGLIAVDRYIYILHGLYYKRWFSTTRVRIGIVLIWMIGKSSLHIERWSNSSGPVHLHTPWTLLQEVVQHYSTTGWVSEELNMTRCFYVSLFPGTLILLNSFLSIIPIIVVVVLYSIILVKALQTVNTINGTIKVKELTPVSEKPKLRVNRGTMIDRGTNAHVAKSDTKLKRSASFTLGTSTKKQPNCRSKSIEDLSGVDKFKTTDASKSNGRSDSDFSVYTIESIASFNLSSDVNEHTEHRSSNPRKFSKVRKIKEPNKWRAITVVLLTTGTFIITWIPFFIAVIFFVFCEEKLTNPKCIQLRFLLGGPFPFLAFTNSIVNPLIYAWWHKGFKKSVKTYYKRYCHKHQLFRVAGPAEELAKLEAVLDVLSATPAAKSTTGQLELLLRLAPEEKEQWLSYFETNNMQYRLIAENLATYDIK
ncbi:Serotonin receptor 8 [Operophtera brumata]|uniref:Serotonin receptor 8 n=1 Tax=Operophtera brumata TaxID=104452 RepID=A0A0L7L7V2_OPEBR|nr:Serotonin receptor 8 [Operophtera brumata]